MSKRAEMRSKKIKKNLFQILNFSTDKRLPLMMLWMIQRADTMGMLFFIASLRMLGGDSVSAMIRSNAGSVLSRQPCERDDTEAPILA